MFWATGQDMQRLGNKKTYIWYEWLASDSLGNNVGSRDERELIFDLCVNYGINGLLWLALVTMYMKKKSL